MSQFPQVNVIDPVSPSTTQNIATASENLNQQAARSLEASRIRQQGEIAKMQADLQATQMEQDAEIAEQQQTLQRDLAKQQSEDSKYGVDEQVKSFAAKNEAEAKMQQERLAAEQKMLDQQEAMKKAADDKLYQRQLEGRMIELRALREDASQRQPYKDEKQKIAAEKARLLVEQDAIEDEAMKNEALRGEIQGKKIRELEKITAPFKEAARLGREVIGASGLQGLGVADASSVDPYTAGLAEESAIGRGLSMLGSGLASAVGIERSLADAARVPPEKIASDLASAFVREGAAAYSGMMMGKNPAAVEGGLKSILDAGMQAAKAIDAVQTDEEKTQLLDKLWEQIKPFSDALQQGDAGLNPTGWAYALDTLGDAASSRGLELRQELAALQSTGENPYLEFHTQGKVEAYELLRKATHVITGAANGKYQDPIETEELSKALQLGWAKSVTPEQASAFIVDNTDVVPDVAKRLASMLSDEDLQKLGIRGKDLTKRVREIERELAQSQLREASADVMLEDQITPGALLKQEQDIMDILKTLP